MLVLIVGFVVLCMSDFVLMVYFGGLVSFFMFGGLFGNFVILLFVLSLCSGWLFYLGRCVLSFNELNWLFFKMGGGLFWFDCDE